MQHPGYEMLLGKTQVETTVSMSLSIAKKNRYTCKYIHHKHVHTHVIRDVER